MPIDKHHVKRNHIWNYTAKKRDKHNPITVGIAHTILKNETQNYINAKTLSSKAKYKKSENSYINRKDIKKHINTFDVTNNLVSFIPTMPSESVGVTQVKTITPFWAFDICAEQEEKISIYDMESPKPGIRNEKSILEMAKESSARHDDIYKSLVHR